jgi:hypothetical protein
MDKAKKNVFSFQGENNEKEKKKETLLFTLLYLFSFRALHLIIITL